MRGNPAQQNCNDALDDVDLRKRFREASEDLTEVTYSFEQPEQIET